jgi:hypothetical protein
MSNKTQIKPIARPELECFVAKADGFESIAVLVNVNHDDPTTFVEREYRTALKAQGIPAGHIHRVRVVSYGTDGVTL